MKKNKNIQELLPYEYKAKRLYKLRNEAFVKMIKKEGSVK